MLANKYHFWGFGGRSERLCVYYYSSHYLIADIGRLLDFSIDDFIPLPFLINLLPVDILISSNSASYFYGLEVAITALLLFLILLMSVWENFN